jgi:predicted unusual protein kinase regulating ubiquinone biosynthesis (AarF/ABC1/UbiB family)
MDELDLENEGDVHRRVARGLRRVDGVTVARVDSELTTPNVHVSAFLEGPTLADGPPPDPGAAARTLVRVFAGAPTAIGVVLANPRANDVVFLGDGSVGLIGPGASRSVDSYRHDEIKAALIALRDGDRKSFVAAVAKIELLPEKHAGQAYDLIEDLLGDLLMNGPAKLDDEVLGAAGDAALARIDELVAIGAHGRPDPADVWPARMLGQITSTLARLGATEDWLALAADALEDGWR